MWRLGLTVPKNVYEPNKTELFTLGQTPIKV